MRKVVRAAGKRARHDNRVKAESDADNLLDVLSALNRVQQTGRDLRTANQPARLIKRAIVMRRIGLLIAAYGA